MHSRRPWLTGHRILTLVVVAAMTIVLVLTFDAGPAEGATRKACRVRNTDSGQRFTRLQAAVAAAKRGDKLAVRGTCAGHTTIGKRLTIVGQRTKRSGGPQLTGRHKTRVLTVAKGAKVKLRGLAIQRGDSKRGGAILNHGDLTLANVTVRRNRCHLAGVALGKAGGILNRGRLRVNGTSRVQRNWCDSGASAVWNAKSGKVVLGGSSVIGFNGGVYGTAVINDGTFVMTGASAIAHNLAGESVGGVFNSGRFVMRDRSTIKGNDCGDPDYCSTGGVENDRGGTFTMRHHSSIRDSDATGVETKGTFTMHGASTISGNTGWCHGGGVYVSGGRFAMSTSSTITGNRVVDFDGNLICELRGAGLYRKGGRLDGVLCAPGTLANVYANSPDDCYLEA